MQNFTPDQLKSHLDAGQSLFLKLWKKGCGACKLSEPAIERLTAEYTHIPFAQISTDEYPEILELTDTEVLPAFFVFENGKLKNKMVGFKGLAKLKELF